MRTIKIVGVSGAGKSTLIRGLAERHAVVRPHCYSDYLRNYGAAANERAYADIASFSGVSVMDEHLEWGDDDLSPSYLRETTSGIVLLEVSMSRLALRRSSDPFRVRSGTMSIAEAEQHKAAFRAAVLAQRCGIPLLHLRDLCIEDALDAVSSHFFAAE